jgi:hypothetical protein
MQLSLSSIKYKKTLFWSVVNKNALCPLIASILLCENFKVLAETV